MQGSDQAWHWFYIFIVGGLDRKVIGAGESDGEVVEVTLGMKQEHREWTLLKWIRAGEVRDPGPRESPEEQMQVRAYRGPLCHELCCLFFFHEEHSFYFVLISFWKSLIFSEGQVNMGYLENTRMNTKVIILLPKKTTVHIRTLSSYLSIHLSPARLWCVTYKHMLGAGIGLALQMCLLSECCVMASFLMTSTPANADPRRQQVWLK